MEYEIADLLRMTPDELDALAEELEGENYHDDAGRIRRYAKHVKDEQRVKILQFMESYVKESIALSEEYIRLGLYAEANLRKKLTASMCKKIRELRNE